MNALLLFDKQQANVCPQCGSSNENLADPDVDAALMSHLPVPVSRSNSNSPWNSTSPTPAPPVQVISTPSERLIVRLVRPPNNLGNTSVVRTVRKRRIMVDVKFRTRISMGSRRRLITSQEEVNKVNISMIRQHIPIVMIKLLKKNGILKGCS